MSPSQGKKSITIELPFPLSINALWRSLKFRSIKSAKYRAWCERAEKAIDAQSPGRVIGEFEVDVYLGRPNKARRDIDNFTKCVLDVLEDLCVIENDYLNQRLLVQWDDSFVGARIVIRGQIGSEEERVSLYRERRRQKHEAQKEKNRKRAKAAREKRKKDAKPRKSSKHARIGRPSKSVLGK